MQRQGRVPWVTSPDDLRILSLSKYGIKVTDDKKQRVYSRHPLHSIANITYYEDTYGKHMVVLRTGQPNPAKNALNELCVYQCNDEVGVRLPGGQTRIAWPKSIARGRVREGDVPPPARSAKLK